MKEIKEMKIASFNISGGFYIGNEDTEYLDRQAAEGVDDKLLSQIIDIINDEQLDVICFQEIITTKEVKYIERIVSNTDLKYCEQFELSPCNIVKNTDCGIAILSKYPITNVVKGKFPNPMLSKTTDSGNTYYTYDKGYMICEIEKEGQKTTVLTHHGFPYRRFNSVAQDNKEVFKYFSEVVEKNCPNIITGDFNTEDFMDLTDFSKYKRTINSVTTVDGKMFDDILIEKNIEYESKIVKLLSDHFIVITRLK